MRKISLILFSSLLLIACSAESEIDHVSENVADHVASYETVDINKVQQLQADGSIILDVREVDEFVEGHIIDAINQPLSALKDSEFGNLDQADSYVVICQSGNRSIEASNILYEAGYDIVNVSEGMSSWTGDIER